MEDILLRKVFYPEDGATSVRSTFSLEMKKLNVLIACEESQAICKEFRRLGHNAYSCDLQECSGGHPEWHFHEDCFSVIKNGGGQLQSGALAFICGDWDFIMAHPPCTYLARSGERWMNEDVFGWRAKLRKEERKKAEAFFLRFVALPNRFVAIENPIGCMNKYLQPDQVIQPWQFGDNVKKSTCLWLKNLPILQVEFDSPTAPLDETFFYRTRYLPTDERRRQRSKTFPGIARAIAEQWSNYIINN